MVKIAPSIVSGPLINLAQSLKELENAGSDIIHFDIEDGVFVPVMTSGMKIIQELRPLSKLPFDVHLMMVNPEWMIPKLADIGANMVSVHYEVCPYPRRILKMIANHGMQAGLAFNSASPIPDLRFCLPYLSFIDVLTTDPEEGDCVFLPSTLEKIKQGKTQTGLENILWQADGGINADNACEAVEAGADILVIGRGIFKNSNVRDNILKIQQVCNSD